MALKRHLRRLRRRLEKTGRAPGAALTPWRESPGAPMAVSIVSYDDHDMVSTTEVSPPAALAKARARRVGWIRVQGLEDVETLSALGNALGLHPLALEDIHHPDQRPKMEIYDPWLFVVLRLLRINGPAGEPEIHSDQLSIAISPGLLATFSERDDDIFQPILARLADPGSFTRRQGVDYLAYRLMDIVVDHYFQALETMGEAIDALSDDLTRPTPDPDAMRRIHRLKAEMMTFRRAVWPLREVIGALQRGDSDLIGDQTRLYLRDLQDHLTHVMETIDTYREMLSGMLDIYLSQISFRINVQIKVMTVIATIFMPLSFIVGVYGMNFVHMPELHWQYGYPAVWALMVAITAAMLVWFRAHKWF